MRKRDPKESLRNRNQSKEACEVLLKELRERVRGYERVGGGGGGQ